jgi:seryl-tRNA(Sec) selenium transferase
LWDVITQSKEAVSKKASRIIKLCGKESAKFIKKIPTQATYGGGSMPGTSIESIGIKINIPGYNPEELYNYFISCTPPIIGTVREDSYILDLFAIFDKDIKDIANSISNLLNNQNTTEN